MAKHAKKKEYYVENLTKFAFNESFFGGDPRANGQRYFKVELDDDDFIDELIHDGLPVNVWPKEPSEKYPTPIRSIKVVVSYKRENGKLLYGPKIHYVDEENCIISDISEEDVAELDTSNIKRFDICFVEHNYLGRQDNEWHKNIYLKEMWVELEKSRYSGKYRRKDDVPQPPVDDDDTPF